MLVRIEEVVARYGVRCGTFGHAGDGNLHPNLVFDRDDPRADEITEGVKDELYRAAIELGGTVTAEHGIGSSRREYLELQRGPDAVAVMRSIKAALDPLGHPQPGQDVPARGGALGLSGRGSSPGAARRPVCRVTCRFPTG